MLMSNKAKEFINKVIENNECVTEWDVRFFKCWRGQSKDTHFVKSYIYNEMEVFVLYHKETYNNIAEPISYFVEPLKMEVQ